MELKQILEEVAKLPVEEQKFFAEYCAHFLKFSELSHKRFPNEESERIDWMSGLPGMIGTIVTLGDNVLEPEQSVTK